MILINQSVDVDDLELAAENGCNESLDDLIPTPNTDNSVNDILLDQLKPFLDAVESLVDRKDVLGYGIPSLTDYFLDVANGAVPNAAKWNVTEIDANSTARAVISTAETPGYLRVQQITTNVSSYIDTRDIYAWSLKGGISEIHFSARIRTNVFAFRHIAIGLLEYDVADAIATNFNLAANESAAIIAKNDENFYANTGDGAALEQTDIKTYLTVNVWHDIEIIVTSSDVKFYVDGTLRATHSTRVPDTCYYAAVSVTRTLDDTRIDVENIKIWTE